MRVYPKPQTKKHKSTGKRLRFSVFQRDNFTCQYCGAQPPDVVLECDHITPVSQGGEATLDNLITACEACNRGKADRLMGDRPVRPDADLMYLEAQQEIAELKRYQTALVEREEQITSVVEHLQELWDEYADVGWVPKDTLIRQMMKKHDLPVIEQALVAVAIKFSGGYLTTQGGKWVGYLYAVARNIAAETEE